MASPREQDHRDEVDREKAYREVRAEAERCRACDLWKPATQTVFGEGPVPASLMLMGETPGDHEDREGHPFVGPAGHLLDEALERAGIDRSTLYLTNAVKHFKFVRGRSAKVRLHKTPNRAEVAACRQWWERELEIVEPSVLGLLGATAAQAVFGPSFRVSKQRGEPFDPPADDPSMNLGSPKFASPKFGSPKFVAIATIHPSAVLRAGERRAEMMDGFVRDLETMARAAAADRG
jgi:DNA polymerase